MMVLTDDEFQWAVAFLSSRTKAEGVSEEEKAVAVGFLVVARCIQGHGKEIVGDLARLLAAVRDLAGGDGVALDQLPGDFPAVVDKLRKLHARLVALHVDIKKAPQVSTGYVGVSRHEITLALSSIHGELADVINTLDYLIDS